MNQRASTQTPDLDWLIIGGGIHGTHVAVRLLGEAGVDRSRLAVVDPAPHLLARWERCTANTGMTHLRSPGVHHLDVHPFSLFGYTGLDRFQREASPDFAAPYNRPSLALFTRHCAAVLEEHGLAALHRQDAAVSVAPGPDSVAVTLASGAVVVARQVVLALGAGDQPAWPASARVLQAAGAPVEHIFEPGFALEPTDWPDRVVVLGGGITGAQAALRFVEAGRSVCLVSRRPLEEHQFDSDPGWIGPKFMRAYGQIEDLGNRRTVITRARHRGSVPPSVHAAVVKAQEAGGLRLLHGEPALSWDGAALQLTVGAQSATADALLLATGFLPQRPGGHLVDALAEDHQLPCAHCGYPVVDAHLRWHPRVFVTGPLAELELGPVSRNIIGARHAAARILAAPGAVPEPAGGVLASEVADA